MSSLQVDNIQTYNSNPPVIKNVSGTEVATFCRAWVNFNGTGTVAIRGSGNVSSITDNGAGNYNINFAAAMPDANYSTVSMSADASAGTVCFIADGSFTPTASSIRIRTAGNSSTIDYDTAYVCIAVFR